MSQPVPLNHEPAKNGPALARTMGLFALIVYGVGDMVGSGVYTLIGKVAGMMGNAVWLAFVGSLVAAATTGLSFASLSSRYPRAAGEAYVAHRAFAQPFLTYLVGLAVVASGLTSMATQSRAFGGYLYGLLHDLAPGQTAPPIQLAVIAVGFILALTVINFWGMRESVWLNMICTFVEVGGLAIIIIVGMRYWGGVNYFEVPPTPEGDPSSLSPGLILSGAVLTFYAFIGFEDMINISEEVKNPRRNMPLGIIFALAIATVIYILVSITAVSVVPYAQLGTSPQPLVDVVKIASPNFPEKLFSLIALFAITNTGLLNYIMGSRLVYGLARQGFVPRALGRIHPTRRTPYLAILVLMVITLVLAASGDIRQLASATSGLLLFVFIVVNFALVILRKRPDEPRGAFEVPVFIPTAGVIVCAALLFYADAKALKISFLLLVGITLLFLISRPSNITEESLAAVEEEA